MSGKSLLMHFEKAIYELSWSLVSKRVLVQNLSYRNEFYLHENKPFDKTHFHINGLARRLVLKERQKALEIGPALSNLKLIPTGFANIFGLPNPHWTLTERSNSKSC